MILLGGFSYFFDLVFLFFWGVCVFLFLVVGFFGDFLLLGVFILLILNCFYSNFGNSLDFCIWFIMLGGVNDADRWRWSGPKIQFGPEVFNRMQESIKKYKIMSG